MKKNKRKIISILLIATSIISIGLNAYSHSGRTDSSGGHKDNKNKSGLGSYHYHCGGNPPHLHTNGVCPYSSKKSTTSSSSSSKSSSSNNSKSTSSSTSTKTTTTTTTTTPSSIAATGIQINENIESMEVGENKKITATITPENTTDKNIDWKTSDESIATISTTGEITAKKAGTVEITASTANGKTNTIKISIKEKEKTENTTIIKTSTINNTANNKVNNTINSNSQDSNPIGGILTLGLLGGGGYWGYKTYKKSKQ
ncbi:MAG: Ig-like domain-containing protein [Clostridia bacterium]|nr:Ig-like domain-containing protein [Clostridia bacterium]